MDQWANRHGKHEYQLSTRFIHAPQTGERTCIFLWEKLFESLTLWYKQTLNSSYTKCRFATVLAHKFYLFFPMDHTHKKCTRTIVAKMKCTHEPGNQATLNHLFTPALVPVSPASLCLRGHDFDFGELPEIDYSPYLRFLQR